MAATLAPRKGGPGVKEPAAHVELTLPADAESVVLARQMVRGLVDFLGWSDESRNDISIAVTEACTNAVLHAYPDGGGEYMVRAWVEPDRLTVTVRDEGGAIAPRGGAPGAPRGAGRAEGPGIAPGVESRVAGLGLGLPLMLAIGDEVSFSSNTD